MRTYCTYFDRNYFVKGLAMIRSLQRHEKRPFTMYVICHDEVTRTLLDAMAISEVITVPFHAIEQGDEALLATRSDRTPVEYYWTATPTVILRLLEAFPAIDVLTYLDADLYFFASPDPVFEALGDDSVLIQPHRYAPALAHLEAESGTYNVGLMAFRNDETGHEVLSWWRDRCLEWCYSRVEEGKMGDQAYLNDWTERFNGVRVLEHVGAGTAPWNVDQYAISSDADRVTVDGQPLVFYHFHALTVVNPKLVIPAIHVAYRLSEPVLRHCYAPYATALVDAVREVRAELPDFSFGIRYSGGMHQSQVLLFDSIMSQALEELGLEGPTLALGGRWHARSTVQLREHDALSKMMEDPDEMESVSLTARPPVAVTESVNATPAQVPGVNVTPSIDVPSESVAAASVPDTSTSNTNGYRVSAIVSTWNAENHIEGCLQDLVDQTLFAQGALEIIVVDAASTQDERTIVDTFAQQHGHIVYVRTSSRETIYQSWNRGIRLASAPYVTNANTDDRHRRDALECLASHLDNHADTALVYADSLITSVANDSFATTAAPLRFGWPEYSYAELERRCFIGPHPMWRRSIHDAHGWFDERYASAGDFEFWLRVGKHETFVRYPDVLGLYYFNPGGLQNSSGVAAREHQDIIHSYGIPQRGVQPAPTPRIPVTAEDLTALRTAGGYASETMDADIAEFNAAVVAQDWNRANVAAQHAVATFPTEPYAWVLRAIGLRLIGKHTEAMNAVAESIKIEETPHALVELMQLGLVTGSSREAEQVAEHLKKKFPDWVRNAAQLMAQAA